MSRNIFQPGSPERDVANLQQRIAFVEQLARTGTTGGGSTPEAGTVAAQSSLTANTSGTGTKITLPTITSAGRGLMIYASIESMTNGTTVRTGYRITDGGTIIGGASVDCSASGTCHPGNVVVYVAPFTGSKTFTLDVTAWGGSPVIRASATEPSRLVAIWV